MDAIDKVQDLGSFRYGQASYRIVATTTPRGGYGASGSATVVIAPTRPPATAASKRPAP
jgi:hypothetical protein